MFCVIRVNFFIRLSSSARAKCPGLGFASFMALLLQSYHSHTSLGLFQKASALARSSDLKFLQSPSLPLKVGTPLSAEIPAPVRTVRDEQFSIISLAADIFSCIS